MYDFVFLKTFFSGWISLYIYIYINPIVARQTGDHRLAEKGPLPSPSDVLTAQARRIGYGCHRVYRLRPDGLMACEDTRENKIVAATRDFDSDSWVRTTTLLTILIFSLDLQNVTHSLEGFEADSAI